LIYARGFGYADLGSTEPVQPYHKFRIASLSKPITAVAIMKLVEQGQLALTDKVFGPNALLDNDPEIGNAQITDTRIFDITVQHLLEHTAGWDRDIDCFPNPTTPYTYKAGGCDPIVAHLHVAQLTNTSNPVTKPALMTFLLEKGLDHTPGVKHAYSNVAYLMLGKVIEKISGVTYKSYLQDSVLALMNICDMDIAKNYKSEKQIREVEYKGNGGGTYNIDGSNVVVPWEYGGLNIEAMDAHGGWIASATDLVKFIVSIDRFTTKPDIL
jgi:CubicO group peptidase (beta-lactamase class C family)